MNANKITNVREKATRPTADELNAHLRNGGQIMIATYGHATIYKPKHAGWFTEGSDGCLYVRYGRGKNCLSSQDQMMVAVRYGRVHELTPATPEK